MIENDKISYGSLAKKLHISEATVKRNIATMKRESIIRRIGPDKGGHWEIIESKK
jgi:ATP-dependent DNA helicase RecG